ncbi:MAG: class I SAM-dependent methyltransferase [Candidatus Aenigmatarchaeota archaeon]
MKSKIWESKHLRVYDKILLHSEIYLAVRDFHISAMESSKTVLDSGAGTGNVTIELLNMGQEVYAVDTSQQAIKILEQKCAGFPHLLHAMHINDDETLPFKKGMFDGVTSMFVISYIRDIESYIREIFRVLKVGGIFALTGRITSQDLDTVLHSYENDLRKKGVLEEYESSFSTFKKNFETDVTKSSVHNHTFHQVRKILLDIGFKDIEEVKNPYFGQCFSLVAYK